MPAGAAVRMELSYHPDWILGVDTDSLRVCRWDAGYSRWCGTPSDLVRSRHAVGTSVTEFGGAEYAVYVVYDGTAPGIGPWVRPDLGEPLVSGDFLRAGDLLEISLADVEGIDPRTIALELDGAATTDSTILDLVEPALEDGTIRWVVAESPAGYHQLRVSASDFYGNSGRDILGFMTAAGLEVAHVLPHPSPFQTATEFTYLLSHDAEDVVLDVYTLSGTLVSRIAGAPAVEGFNRVSWDGRDHDGHTVANGVYLYRLRARANGRTVTKLGRVAKMG